MNIKNNQRYIDTENKIRNALLELVKEKDISKITVSDICKTASTNRSTFYAHFLDIPDLMEKINIIMRRELSESFKSENIKETYETGEFLIPFLTYIKDHAYFYRASLETRTEFPIKEGYDSLMELVVRPICSDHGITSEKQIYYSLTFMQAGFTTVLKNWVKNNCEDSIYEIAQYLKTCMNLSKKC